MRGTHGWGELRSDDKRAIIDALRDGTTPPGPFHLEIDLTDRCNVDCYFCNQMDVRTKEQIPYARIVQILDEAAPTVRSLRFAGGGDPLFHREIAEVLDAVQAKGLVVDNITTNGVGLTPAVAERLVANECREVLISLNAVDAPDYARMMQVKPAMFDKVTANVRHLRAIRGEKQRPWIVVQFLLDRVNYARALEMYELGRELGADTIVIFTVLDIPLDRIDQNVLLQPEDAESLRPIVRALIEADRDHELLQIQFGRHEFNAVLAEVEAELKRSVSHGFTTAPSFDEKNGQCFFGYYSAVVRGNGDLYPCCMLLKPDYKPLGNAVRGPLLEQWRDGGFAQLRHEMREVMLAGGEAEYRAGEYRTLAPECVNAFACGLKNMYFRSDEKFYRELGEAMNEARRREIRFTGNRQQFARALQRVKTRHPRLRRAYERVAQSSPRLRALLKRTLGVRLASR